MRIARTLVLALAAAIAAMAFASTANATSPIEAFNEDTGAACDVGLQNCEIVAHSEGHTLLIGHVIGFESTESQCFDEFTGYLGADGSGHLLHQDLTGGEECTRTPCEGQEGEWPASAEEIGTNELNMEIRFCLDELDENNDPAGTPVHCELDVHVEVLGHHSAEFLAEDSGQSDHAKRCHHVEGTSADVEVEGHWVTDAQQSDEIEIEHH